MRTDRIIAFCLLGFLSNTSCNQPSNSNASHERIIAKKVWECTIGLSVPESVLFDTVNKFIYVSNIHGNPAEMDGLGYISRLSPDGDLLDSAWVGGLNAPKGMAIMDNILYVSDLYRLVAIDISSAQIINTYAAEGAGFLNDVSINASGTVFVSDMRMRRIYALMQDTLTLWFEDTLALNRVNGLLAFGDTLFAGTANSILAFPHSSSSTEYMTIADSTGSIDGLERLGQAWVFSDWLGHVTFREAELSYLILDTTPDTINAADIDVVTIENLLLVPTFFHNSISAYKLEINESK